MSAQRIAVIGKLKQGSLERAEEIVDRGPPFELDEAGLERNTVFLSSEWVVFVFEGPNVEGSSIVSSTTPSSPRASAAGARFSTGRHTWFTSASSGNCRVARRHA